MFLQCPALMTPVVRLPPHCGVWVCLWTLPRLPVYMTRRVTNESSLVLLRSCCWRFELVYGSRRLRLFDVTQCGHRF